MRFRVRGMVDPNDWLPARNRTDERDPCPASLWAAEGLFVPTGLSIVTNTSGYPDSNRPS
ncbi:hypothetical protein HMPREF1531_02449 [Propionibacterium sp. oral taxon 192 str. F0372]|nr:hypothetical protein HMPREF1531_02449 [Propionibacterium sp. oral taxon 192 str. F0372]